jgi:1-acyl-sn-glycerol-3-phosphate acyltransferase
MEIAVKPHNHPGAIFWLFFFLISNALVGFFLIYLIYVPNYFLSHFLKKLKKYNDFFLLRGSAFLMKHQPWYRPNVSINLPKIIPKKGMLLISNHRSILDVFILLGNIPGIKFLAKSSLFKVPFLGIIMRTSNQISVPKGDVNSYLKAMNQIRNRLRKGEIIHIFPEMTRCPLNFVGVQKFSMAPFQVAFSEKVSILPIAISGTDQAWPKGVMGIFFRKPIKVSTLDILNSENYTHPRELRDEVQKRIESAIL